MNHGQAHDVVEKVWGRLAAERRFSRLNLREQEAMKSVIIESLITRGNVNDIVRQLQESASSAEGAAKATELSAMEARLGEKIESRLGSMQTSLVGELKGLLGSVGQLSPAPTGSRMGAPHVGSEQENQNLVEAVLAAVRNTSVVSNMDQVTKLGQGESAPVSDALSRLRQMKQEKPGDHSDQKIKSA